MSARTRAGRKTTVHVTEEELARAFAASFLICPMPETKGDLELFWKTRGSADRKIYEKRAKALFRMLTLPDGEAGHKLQPARERRGA